MFKPLFLERGFVLYGFIIQIEAVGHHNQFVIIIICAMDYCDTASCKFI